MKKFLSVALMIVMMISVSALAFATEEDAVVNLAYMDLDQANIEMQESILEARKQLILSESWVMDGLQGFVYDENGNIVEEVPQFSEIFPSDWEVPVLDTTLDIDQKSIDNSQEVRVLSNDDTVMVTVFSDTLELKIPSKYFDSPAFKKFETTYWKDYYYYDMKYVYTLAYDQDASPFYKNYFNVGYTNATTGEALGVKTNIESGYTFGITTPSDIEIAVRASMYSDNDTVTSGDWKVSVFAYCNIIN